MRKRRATIKKQQGRSHCPRHVHRHRLGFAACLEGGGGIELIRDRRCLRIFCRRRLPRQKRRGILARV